METKDLMSFSNALTSMIEPNEVEDSIFLLERMLELAIDCNDKIVIELLNKNILELKRGQK